MQVSANPAVSSPLAPPANSAAGQAMSSAAGRQAVLAALEAFSAESVGRKPWMEAEDLARHAGAAAGDAQFTADVQALFEAGTIRLMSGGNAGGGSFYKAMLVPPLDALPPDPEEPTEPLGSGGGRTGGLTAGGRA